jgi:hypothetical protein
MTEQHLRLSVPPPRTSTPRPLDLSEQTVFTAIADKLCYGGRGVGPPSKCPEFQSKLELALATRSDVFDLIVDALHRAARAVDLDVWLRALHDLEQTTFAAVSTVAAGAYLMVPSVRDAIGYRGQYRDRPGLTEAVDELTNGVLDPVIARGAIYVLPPTPRT